MSWHIETNSMGKVVLICNDKGHPLARMVDDRDYASAALIASAPDLLNALTEMAEIAESKGHIVSKARAAITKATGGKS